MNQDSFREEVTGKILGARQGGVSGGTSQMEANYLHRHTAECTAWEGNAELSGLTGKKDSERASMDWDKIRHAILEMQTLS